MKKLNDFGEKIGGAKKDLWALFNSLSNEEQGEMAQKTKLWKRPDYRAVGQEGTPKEVFQSEEFKQIFGAEELPDYVRREKKDRSSQIASKLEGGSLWD